MQLESDDVPWVSEPPGGVMKSTREWAAAYPECAAEEWQTPFLPIRNWQVDRILPWAALTADDVVCDLGFGDGSFLIRASSVIGCQCTGVEINGDLVERAKANAASMGSSVSSLIDLQEGSFQQFMSSESFAKATVIFVHLVPGVLQKMAEQLDDRIATGVRVISQGYEIPGLCSRKTSELAYNCDDERDPTTDEALAKFMGHAFLYSQ
ncbi:unnamed protein product [Prorocentrum cordatum]|uniref:Methyltransferase domain-containing protein n=1 Tax=Prorocentrum cordatum TaxID=2364126 RepID=A0ABN9UFF2_9DINO|nr:unnamed protein product [Polarella glacialis]